MAVEQRENHHGKHPDLNLGRREMNIITGQREIASEEDPQAACHDVPAREGHGRLGTMVNIQQQPAEVGAPKILSGGFSVAGERGLQVRSRAKHFVAGSSNRNDAHLTIIDSLAHRVAQSLENRGIQRVTLLGPVYRNARDPILHRVKHAAHDGVKISLERRTAYENSTFVIFHLSFVIRH